MGLFGFISDLVAIARLKNATREMVQNGVISPDQEREIWGSAADAGRRSLAGSRQNNSQHSVGYNCCSNCKFFSWGECWYFYEGNPGFNYNQYRRYDDHGETREIDDPDGSICDGYERDYNK